MPSLRSIKDKITNVKSIKKIFSVMQMIAASKMYRAQEEVNSSNYVIDNIKNLFVRAVDGDISSVGNLAPVNLNAPVLYIIFSSDRGLCGNYNNIVFRKIQENLNQNNNAKLIIVGNKVTTLLSSKYNELIDYKNSIKFDDARKDMSKIVNLLENVFDMYKSGAISDCQVIYVHSKNAMTKSVKQVNFFKIDELASLLSKKSSASNTTAEDVKNDGEIEPRYIYEGSKLEVIDYLLQFFLKARFFNIFRNAYFSELASRMIAMDNASRNSGEIEKELVTFYNKKRQANITSDLIDIINGAENA